MNLKIDEKQDSVNDSIYLSADKSEMFRFARSVIKNVTPNLSTVMDLYEKMAVTSLNGFYDDYEKAETELLSIITNVWEKNNGTRPETDN